MNRRRVLSAGFLAAIAAVLVSAPAHAAAGESTCVPGTKVFSGAYVALDNAWLEKAQCVRFNSATSVTITGNAVPVGGTVVAYPSIRYGAFYTYRDAASGLPLRVTDLRKMTLHVASTGHATGGWQSDADIYFHPTPASIAHHHASFELVISNRYAWAIGGKGDPWTRIHRTWFRWASWMTCQHTATRCDPRIPLWRIAAFFQVHQKAKERIYVPAFTWFLIRQHLLPAGDVLSSAAYGTELWSGGKGLTDSMTVTGLGIPHLHPGGN